MRTSVSFKIAFDHENDTKDHRKVLKLLGFCLETHSYEFISNGTVYEHLHDQNQSLTLTWKTRLRIAKEIAGLLSWHRYFPSKRIEDVHFISMGKRFSKAVTLSDKVKCF
ncbi:wall-associated kinase family protein, putative [Medicago truncatula]|uniref:Wall-associated kinase family protein, putative n=1 Tax=Medicago truncatula TaxID=3880 RepID=G7JTK3_MEDTR|nr:wall-associated kinase family protein, putative [Medicago truncatula]